MYWLPAILIVPYFILFIRIRIGLRKIKGFSFSSAPTVRVSVIVACRNEEKNLPSLLESISLQDYPGDHYEVIIVDDNSDDSTFNIASGYTLPCNLRVIRNQGKGKKEAVRSGIEASSGTLIITTDADCSMGPGWIKTIAAFRERYDPDMIICPVRLGEHPGFFGKFQSLEFLGLQGVTAGSALLGNAVMCNGANLAFTRETYLKHMENLHPGLVSGDDIFLLHSLKKDHKAKILWLESQDAVVTTAPSASLWSYLSQRERWISKAGAYNDGLTIFTGIMTFSAALVQLSFLIPIFFNFDFIAPFAVVFLIKSVPDYLILKNTSSRYGKEFLMPLFIPAQFIYPVYVLFVVLRRLIPRREWKI
jgi:poly-beta-1,6-N-acetyl-D-glucosamine synthase